MTHTTLFKNEIYLIVTSLVSLGVLSGYAYFYLALAALLIMPVLNLPVVNLFNKENLHSADSSKCVTCK